MNRQIDMNQLIGKVIPYHWGGKIRQGKLVRIKSGVLIIEDLPTTNQSGVSDE